MSSSSSCEVLVSGAGPAGAVLATILARAGRDVVLVHRAGPESVVEETIVPSARPLLARLGLLGLLDAPEFRGTKRSGRVWGTNEVVTHAHDETLRGFKVARRA